MIRFYVGATSPKTDIYTFEEQSWEKISVEVKPKEAIIPSKRVLKSDEKPATIINNDIANALRKYCYGDWKWAWSCEHMVATFYAESKLNHLAKSEMRGDAYYFWICQLSSKFHGQFINSEGSETFERQAEYCAAVWNNAFVRKLHPNQRRQAYR